MWVLRKFGEKDCGKGDYKVNQLKMVCGRVIQAVYYGPKKSPFKSESRYPAGESSRYGAESRDRLDMSWASLERKPNTKRMCYKCDACKLELDCGKCDFCLDRPKFGGKSQLRQKCRMKQCSVYSRFAKQDWRCGSQDALDDFEHWEQERKKMCKSMKLRKLLLRSRQVNQLMPSNAIHTPFGNQPQNLDLGWRELQDELSEDEEECNPERTKKELPNSPQTMQTTPSKISYKPLQRPHQHLRSHWASRSQKQLDNERMQRRRENKRRWRLKRKLLLQSRPNTQRFPRKASHPSSKTPPQVVLNGKFKVKHLQVGGTRITFRDLFVKLHNLMESMKYQALDKRVSYLHLGGQRIYLRRPFAKPKNLKNMEERDQSLNKETSQPPPLPWTTDDSQEGSHPVDSESMTVTSQPPPLPWTTDDSQEGSHPVDSESMTVNPQALPPSLSTDISQEGEGSHLVESEYVTVAPICDPLEGERLIPVEKECMTMVPRSCSRSRRIDPLQGDGSTPVDAEGMTTVKSPLLVLATIFYKKMEIRKRKYKIFTIKELIETCNQELDYYVEDNHDSLERIQIYDNDFSEYVDFDINTDEVKNKDRFLVYFRESKCQCADSTNCSQVQVAESSNVYPSNQRQPPPSDINDYLIQGNEEVERDNRMPVIMEIVSLGSCLAVSRRADAQKSMTDLNEIRMMNQWETLPSTTPNLQLL